MPSQTTRIPIREAILEAAPRLLGRLGYRKSTMDDLAREAGVGRRSIYVHFTSKEEVFLASIDRVVENLITELESIAASDSPPAERLQRMLVVRVLFRFDSVHGYYQSLDEMFSVLRPAYLERRERYIESEAAVFARVCTEGERDGSLQITDATESARTMLLATSALLPYSLSARELGSRREIERQVERVAELLLRGLVKRKR